jgi:aminoglycoside 6'-N-acetyltransferase
MPISFRPLVKEDLPVLASWLARPHVMQWWREAADLAPVEAAYLPLIDGTDPTEAFLALRSGQPVGYLQRYRLDDNPEWQQAILLALRDGGDAGDAGEINAVGIDYLIADETLTGQGLGRMMISDFVDDSWRRYPDSATIAVAVQQDNHASWRALEGAGFVRRWAGTLASGDPSDAGPSYVYLKERPAT